jgi:hypothetical protein
MFYEHAEPAPVIPYMVCFVIAFFVSMAIAKVICTGLFGSLFKPKPTTARYSRVLYTVNHQTTAGLLLLTSRCLPVCRPSEQTWPYPGLRQKSSVTD